MMDPAQVPPVAPNELLARFIVNRGEYRPSDDTVKPRLFCPYSRVELSVNRHRESDESELLLVGREVAAARGCNYHGRTDIQASSCQIDGLMVVANPIKDDSKVSDNPNHADIIGFPPKKEDQMSIAQKLAASASKRIAPPSRDDGPSANANA